MRTGLEPATLGVTGRYSNRLNYRTNCQYCKFLLAVRTGLEPATLGVTGRYSNQLNYHRICKNGGHYWTRTSDIYLVRVALYQLS